jgi:hypothetical protein
VSVSHFPAKQGENCQKNRGFQGEFPQKYLIFEENRARHSERYESALNKGIPFEVTGGLFDIFISNRLATLSKSHYKIEPISPRPKNAPKFHNLHHTIFSII